MESIAVWFAGTLGQKISAEAVIFIVSMLPLLECRGGLLVASILKVNIWRAIPICVIGNLLPIPFVLFFIKKIFTVLKRISLFRPLIEKLEKRGEAKSESLKNGEFLGLMLFVGIPLPGTGGWTGALAASILEMKKEKALPAIFLGVLLATVIMSIVSYGLLSAVMH